MASEIHHVEEKTAAFLKTFLTVIYMIYFPPQFGPWLSWVCTCLHGVIERCAPLYKKEFVLSENT